MFEGRRQRINDTVPAQSSSAHVGPVVDDTGGYIDNGDDDDNYYDEDFEDQDDDEDNLSLTLKPTPLAALIESAMAQEQLKVGVLTKEHISHIERASGRKMLPGSDMMKSQHSEGLVSVLSNQVRDEWLQQKYRVAEKRQQQHKPTPSSGVC